LSRILKQEWKFLGSDSSDPDSKLTKQVVFSPLLLSSSPVREKMKIEAWGA